MKSLLLTLLLCLTFVPSALATTILSPKHDWTIRTADGKAYGLLDFGSVTVVRCGNFDCMIPLPAYVVATVAVIPVIGLCMLGIRRFSRPEGSLPAAGSEIAGE